MEWKGGFVVAIGGERNAWLATRDDAPNKTTHLGLADRFDSKEAAEQAASPLVDPTEVYALADAGDAPETRPIPPAISSPPGAAWKLADFEQQPETLIPLKCRTFRDGLLAMCSGQNQLAEADGSAMRLNPHQTDEHVIVVDGVSGDYELHWSPADRLWTLVSAAGGSDGSQIGEGHKTLTAAVRAVRELVDDVVGGTVPAASEASQPAAVGSSEGEDGGDSPAGT